MLIVLALALLVGALMGLTGSGGGILAVPVLVFGFGWSIQQAMPVALVAVVCSASIGAVDGLRQGLTRYRAAMLMALTGIPFSSLGVQLGQFLSPRALTGVFALLMLALAWRDFSALHRREVHAEAPSDAAVCRIDPSTGQFRWTMQTAFFIAAIGAVTGLSTGLLGVGGAFIMVPLLRRYTDISAQSVIATVLMVMALVAAGGLAMAAYHGVAIPQTVAVLFALSTSIGMLVGRLGVRRVDPRRLRQIYAWLVLIVAVAMGAKAIWS